MTETTDDSAGSEETTKSVDTRHKYTNDGLAYLLVISTTLLLGCSAAFDFEVPGMLWQMFALSVALATTWAFGKGALKELLGAVQGGGGK